MSELKRTPLASVHEALGAKMVEFAGYTMPVLYQGIIAEHRAVRENAGMFDVSHMGEFFVRGDRAREFVNEVITNDLTKVTPGGLQYSVMCREDGTAVDDLLVFVLADDEVMLVVNAANIEKDFEHISSFDRKGCEIVDASEEFALIAVQGPRAGDVLEACDFFDDIADRLRATSYYRGFRFAARGADVIISRTGYTGEYGFEVFVSPSLAVDLWNAITGTGGRFGLVPVGLGARDTLRFEAGYCLYGHELDDETTPLEAGLGWVVKVKKDRFRGRDALRAEKKEGSKRRLLGLELEGRNIARQGYALLADGEEVGKVTSGAFAPTLEKSLCMAMVESAHADRRDFAVAVRKKTVPARRTSLPFYKSRAKED